MTAEVQNVMAQLAAIETEIVDPVTSGSIYAYPNVPYTISAVDMPLFVNFAKNLISNQVAGSDERGREFQEVRNYDLVLYHSPYGAGVEDEKLGDLQAYFKLVYDKFGGYPHLKQLGGVMDALITQDSGMSIVEFGGQHYFGIRFTLRVTASIRRAFVSD